MRINVYSQELTSEVKVITKESNTGVVYTAAQLVLHSSPMLHHPPEDDDRSAVTFWLPTSEHRCEEMARAFEAIAHVFRTGIPPTVDDCQRAVAREQASRRVGTAREQVNRATADVEHLKATLAAAEASLRAANEEYHAASRAFAVAEIGG